MAATSGARPQSSGLLSVAASQTTKQASVKQPATKLKLVVRRLPPGLTEDEFDTILGQEWRAGSGKVDWLLYKPGKDSSE